MNRMEELLVNHNFAFIRKNGGWSVATLGTPEVHESGNGITIQFIAGTFGFFGSKKSMHSLRFEGERAADRAISTLVALDGLLDDVDDEDEAISARLAPVPVSTVKSYIANYVKSKIGAKPKVAMSGSIIKVSLPSGDKQLCAEVLRDAYDYLVPQYGHGFTKVYKKFDSFLDEQLGI